MKKRGVLFLLILSLILFSSSSLVIGSQVYDGMACILEEASVLGMCYPGYCDQQTLVCKGTGISNEELTPECTSDQICNPTDNTQNHNYQTQNQGDCDTYVLCLLAGAIVCIDPCPQNSRCLVDWETLSGSCGTTQSQGNENSGDEESDSVNDNSQTIVCTKDSDCGNNYNASISLCLHSQLCSILEIQYSCENPGTNQSNCIINKEYNCDPCENGCFNGACSKPIQATSEANKLEILCSSNTDCGEKNTTLYCSNDDLCRTLIQPSCLNPGLDISKCSLEVTTRCTTCPYGCVNNECEERPVIIPNEEKEKKPKKEEASEPTDENKKGLGQTCSMNSDCASGYCKYQKCSNVWLLSRLFGWFRGLF